MCQGRSGLRPLFLEQVTHGVKVAGLRIHTRPCASIRRRDTPARYSPAPAESLNSLYERGKSRGGRVEAALDCPLLASDARLRTCERPGRQRRGCWRSACRRWLPRCACGQPVRPPSQVSRRLSALPRYPLQHLAQRTSVRKRVRNATTTSSPAIRTARTRSEAIRAHLRARPDVKAVTGRRRSTSRAAAGAAWAGS